MTSFSYENYTIACDDAGLEIIQNKKRIALYSYKDLEPYTQQDMFVRVSMKECVCIIAEQHLGWRTVNWNKSNEYYAGWFYKRAYLDQYKCDICNKINCNDVHPGEETPERLKKKYQSDEESDDSIEFDDNNRYYFV
jgi:hypothetical protein